MKKSLFTILLLVNIFVVSGQEMTLRLQMPDPPPNVGDTFFVGIWIDVLEYPGYNQNPPTQNPTLRGGEMRFLYNPGVLTPIKTSNGNPALQKYAWNINQMVVDYDAMVGDFLPEPGELKFWSATSYAPGMDPFLPYYDGIPMKLWDMRFVYTGGNITIAFGPSTSWVSWEGDSDDDYALTLKNIPDIPCALPFGLMATNITVSSAEIHWQSPSNLSNLEWGEVGFVPGTGTQVNDISGGFYLLEGLALSTSYDVYVQEDCGTGGFSDWVGPETFQLLCASPFSLNVSNVSFTSANVNWESPSGFSNLEWGEAGFVPGTGTQVNDITGGSYTLLGLTPNTTYDVYVQDSCGISDLSAWVGPETFLSVCATPNSINVSNITGTAADIIWQSPSGFSNLEWGETGFIPGTGTQVNDIMGGSYSLLGLSPNTTYDVYVQDSCGIGDLSEWVGPFAFSTPCFKLGVWTKAESPYLINCDLFIPAGDTLIIEPGVEVIFEDYYTFEIQGTLIAKGAENDSIKFTISDTTGYYNDSHNGWGGLNLSNSIFTEIEYCIVEYSKTSGINLSNIDLTSSTVRYNNTGITIFGNYSSVFENNNIVNNKTDGINIVRSFLPITISSCNILNNGESGINYTCELIVEDCTINDNSRGLNVTGDNNDTSVRNSIFENNGYAVYTWPYGNYNDSDIDSCIFRGNEVCVKCFTECYTSISNSLFENNGIAISTQADCNVHNCIIRNNNKAISASLNFYSQLSISNCTIENNTSSTGGIISCNGGEICTINNCTITNNTAIGNGGGIYCTSNKLVVGGCIIKNNIATNGGGIYYNCGITSNTGIVFINSLLADNQAVEKGGGVYCEEGLSLFENITITNNSAGISGGALYCNYTEASKSLTDIISWNNSPDEIVDTAGNLSITYSNIEGGWPGTGNIDSDPLFIDPENGDYHLSWLNFPYHDSTKSPCIGTGLDGTDMGAYSFGAMMTLDLKVMIEGPYLNGQMTPSLNVLNQLPNKQPYNTGPWNYDGNDSVVSIPFSYIVDWVLVELLSYDTTSKNSYNVIGRQAGFLLNNGAITGLDGLSLLQVRVLDSCDFYVRIYHRNHIPIVTSNVLTKEIGVYSWDFTTGAENVLGGIYATKEISTNVWGMIAADGNADNQIDNKDKNDIWIIQKDSFGYLSGDYNMDSQVDLDDKIIMWQTNVGKGVSVSDSIFYSK